MDYLFYNMSNFKEKQERAASQFGALVRRSVKTRNYTNIDNRVFDTGISCDAAGVLIYILTKPDGWVVRKCEISARFNMGKDKTARIFNELKELGFVVEVGKIRSNGKFDGFCYVVYDYEEAMENKKNKSLTDLPQAEKPYAEKPYAENPPLINNNIKEINEKEKKINLLIGEREEDSLNFLNNFNKELEPSIEERESFNPKNKKKENKTPSFAAPLYDLASEIVSAWNEFGISKQSSVPFAYLSKIETLFIIEGNNVSDYKKVVSNMKLSGHFEKEGRSLNFLTTIDENYFYRFLNWVAPKKQPPMYKTINFDS